MTGIFTAFEGQRRLISGPLVNVALAVKRASQRASEPIAIFSDTTGRTVDLDLRGTADDIRARLAKASFTDQTQDVDPLGAPRGRGRPKLGVIAREVTLLPRHWAWLNEQPGGASVALRKLVDQARRLGGDADRRRQARDAAYHFMSAMAGDFPNFEEAARALFADDATAFAGHIAAWPNDVRDHIVKLAYTDQALAPS